MTNINIEFEAEGADGGIVSDWRDMPDVLLPVQTHSCNVAVIGPEGAIPALDDTDAVISLRSGLRIGVRTADCVPLLVYCPDIRAVAAIHAGWRGSIGGIVNATLQRLQELGADMSKAEAVFGPSICGECYEISEELADRFEEAGFADCFVEYRHIDLESVNRRQLLAAGILPENIRAKAFCTFETALLPSWRRLQTDRRLLTWIELTQ